MTVNPFAQFSFYFSEKTFQTSRLNFLSSERDCIFIAIFFIIREPQYDAEFDHLLRGKEAVIGGSTKRLFPDFTSSQVATIA